MKATAKFSDGARVVYDQLLAGGIIVPTADNILEYRANLIAASKQAIENAIAAFDGDVEDIEVVGIRCQQLTPSGWSANSDLCVLYAYGGGYVSGSTGEDMIMMLPLAHLARARIVMVDYRLSPEHPYPAAQQDMRDVYRALLEQYEATKLVVSGESAGGNQALQVMQYARDQQWPMPQSAALFSPWVDLTHQGDSHSFNDARDPTLNNAWVDSAAKLHGAGIALDDPGISPLFGDMRGLPPCIITTGSRDLLMSQCLDLARKLRDAAVECDLRVWDGMWHVFEFYPVAEAESSLREVAAFIQAHR